MATSVRQFPTIKAVRSFVIGGVGSGMARRNLFMTKKLLTHGFCGKVATTTMLKVAIGM